MRRMVFWWQRSVAMALLAGAWLPGNAQQVALRPSKPQSPPVWLGDGPAGPSGGPAPQGPGTGPLSSVLNSWEGMKSDLTLEPPDPHGAAGPNGILQVINVRMEYWDKT